MSEPVAFGNLVDLAAADLGGQVVGVSDDYFASAQSMLASGRARFDESRYTDRGKWMDGWESRRKRGGGHDWCVVQLGAAGRVYGFDVDTQHFIGNHPPYAAVDAIAASSGTCLDELMKGSWVSLLAQSALRPGSQNLFVSEPADVVSHVRLSIFPDGGVARFRVYGKVAPCLSPAEIDDCSRPEVSPGLIDLAALKNGARALACSDARFGHMNSLLLPGRARVMGEGWETRRGRPPGHDHDWIIIQLAARGSLRVIEVDTNHYKGNFPERCQLEGIDWPEAQVTELIGPRPWIPLTPVTPLAADTRAFLRREILPHGPVSHVRLRIFPDGGISRLRLWGVRNG